ncbi:bifunctional UDP-sugar hydrolase/5'-nucleotidase periplasmic precursor [Metamycoplasma alkalescens]|uniref:5'-nucleotidase-like protein n=2 Tax=Metamycoplasma alkalescens TaxID=45363 RepID=A0A318U7F5_9BACT|nr:5'-nucleotidase-like protein [Metamycoplasma alkalescens]SYV90792.1 bifunctional UDP-sugar hydrolase/5'-nucleotidase periplasmic precursor [Metamycoplasma alkalescens]
MKHGALKTLSGGYGQYSHNVEAKIKVKSEDERNKRVYEIDENSIKINNKSIDKDKFYYVVTNDFILVGGDGYGMLNYTKQKDSVKQIFEGRDMVEVFIDYGKQITSNKNQDNDSNPFSKRKISDYDKSVQQKIIVDHKVE